MTRELTRTEGLYVGGSSGAAVSGAIKYAEMTGRKENILVLLPDSASKYLSKIFNEEWMRQNGFLDQEDPLGTVAHMLRARPDREIITAKSGQTVRQVIQLLKQHEISQAPVMSPEGKLLGIVSETDLLKHLLASDSSIDAPVEGLVEADYAIVTPDTKVALLRSIFNDAKLVVVKDRADELIGLITKIDLIEYLAARR